MNIFESALLDIGYLNAIPLLLSVNLVILIITGKWKKDVNLVIMMSALVVAFTFFALGYFEHSVHIILSTSLALTLWSVARDRNKGKTNEARNN
jgi:hypothetical protein